MDRLTDAGAVDFALSAWREEDGSWEVMPVPTASAVDLDGLIAFLRRLPATQGALGFVSVADEFLVIVRVSGQRVRVLCSDLNAAADWPLAEQVADFLGIDAEDEIDLREVEPAGDLTLLEDFGLSAADLDMICTDVDLYPDEQVSEIADRLGVGALMEDRLDEALA